MGDEPRLARIDSDVPKAMIKSMKTKLTYRRVHSARLLFIVFLGIYGRLMTCKVTQFFAYKRGKSGLIGSVTRRPGYIAGGSHEKGADYRNGRRYVKSCRKVERPV